MARWQFQSDTRAPERDYPHLGHAEVLCDRWRVCSKVLGGLAWQHVDLYPPWRSGVRQHHSWRVHHLTAGDGVLGATRPTPDETVLHALDEQLVPGPRSGLRPGGGHSRPPRAQPRRGGLASSTSLSARWKALPWGEQFIGPYLCVVAPRQALCAQPCHGLIATHGGATVGQTATHIR